MIKGKTQSGFEFEIDDVIIKDWKTLELFSELDENPFKMIKLVKTLLGKNQYNNLMKHCGYKFLATVEEKEEFDKRMFQEMNEIISTNDTKN